jgi:uncharacterized membrane protein YfcA
VLVDPGALAALVAVVAVAALVNGALGFGFALLAVNALAFVLGAKSSVVLMGLVAPVISGLQIWHFRGHRGVLPRVLRMIGFALLGSVIGTNVLVFMPGWAISLALGLFTAWYVAGVLRGARPPMEPARAARLAPVAGLVGGISNGTLGASGPILGSYLVAIGLRGGDFAWGISAAFFSMGLVRLGLLAAFDQFTPALVVIAAILVLPSIAGQRVGFWLRGRLPAEQIERLVLVLLLLASANLLWRGLDGLRLALPG